MPHKKLSLKARRKSAARKGARTKRDRSELTHAVHCLRLLRAGMSPQEISLEEGTPLREVLRLLRLATFVPHPIGKIVGIGATIADEALRFGEGKFGRDIESFKQGAEREINELTAAIANLQRTVGEIGSVLKKNKMI